jgi:tight adherence protein C
MFLEYVLCIVAAAVAAFAFAEAGRRSRSRRRAIEASVPAALPRYSPLHRHAAALGTWLAMLADRLGCASDCARARKKLEAAGIEANHELALGSCALCVIAAAFAAMLFAASADAHRLLAAAAGAAGACASVEAALRSRARTRREAFERELPFALDLLTLCVEAGLDFGAAIARVASRARKGPLARELAHLDAALRMGMPRCEALAALGQRSATPLLAVLCAMLIQADRVGSGVAPVLRAHAARLRSSRFARAERCGALAAQKALVPLIVCIMPATFVIVFGPLFVRVAIGGAAALF